MFRWAPSLVFDLVPVLPGRFAALLEIGITLQFLREEVEVFAPGDIGAVHHGGLAGDEIELVIGQRQIIICIMQRLVVFLGRQEARVLLGDLQLLHGLGQILGGIVAVGLHQAVALFIIGVAEVGKGHRKLLVDELLVLRQRQHILEFLDRRVVVVLVV